MPKVGDMAPDFTLAAGTRAGVSAKPVTLSDLRGQTVVIAFYPKQRSSGCTIQMRHYRDEYDQIFHGGKGVTLLAISTDSVKDIASWAADSSFQWTFLSDVNKDAGHGVRHGRRQPVRTARRVRRGAQRQDRVCHESVQRSRCDVVRRTRARRSTTRRG